MGLYSTQALENIFQHQLTHEPFTSDVTFKSEDRTRSKCGLSNTTAAQHGLQATGRGSGSLSAPLLYRPAPEPGRWAEFRRGRPQAGGWNGSPVCPGSFGQVVLGGGRCPTFRAADLGGSGPVDDVGGPGG